MDHTNLLQWAFQQGALTVLVLVGGYFYRRDFAVQVSSSNETIKTLIGIVTQINQTQAEQTIAIREQAIATQQLSSALKELRDELRRNPLPH
jgi:hypothetical protein